MTRACAGTVVGTLARACAQVPARRPALLRPVLLRPVLLRPLLALALCLSWSRALASLAVEIYNDDPLARGDVPVTWYAVQWETFLFVSNGKQTARKSAPYVGEVHFGSVDPQPEPWSWKVVSTLPIDASQRDVSLCVHCSRERGCMASIRPQTNSPATSRKGDS